MSACFFRQLEGGIAPMYHVTLTHSTLDPYPPVDCWSQHFQLLFSRRTSQPPAPKKTEKEKPLAKSQGGHEH